MSRGNTERIQYFSTFPYNRVAPTRKATPKKGAAPSCLCLSREEFVVDGIDCFLELRALDEAGNADLRRADDVDVDLGLRQSAEHARRDARVAEHA